MLAARSLLSSGSPLRALMPTSEKTVGATGRLFNLRRLCLGDSAGMSATAARSSIGEGDRRWFLGTLATIRVPGEAVGGRFALIEFLFPQHASPPRHTHPQDESYVAMECQLTIEAGEERFILEADGIAVV